MEVKPEFFPQAQLTEVIIQAFFRNADEVCGLKQTHPRTVDFCLMEAPPFLHTQYHLVNRSLLVAFLSKLHVGVLVPGLYGYGLVPVVQNQGIIAIEVPGEVKRGKKDPHPSGIKKVGSADSQRHQLIELLDSLVHVQLPVSVGQCGIQGGLGVRVEIDEADLLGYVRWHRHQSRKYNIPTANF